VTSSLHGVASLSQKRANQSTAPDPYLQLRITRNKNSLAIQTLGTRRLRPPGGFDRGISAGPGQRDHSLHFFGGSAPANLMMREQPECSRGKCS
jgi:hypothetical protein